MGNETERCRKLRLAYEAFEEMEEGEDLHHVLQKIALHIGETRKRTDFFKNWQEGQMALADHYAHGYCPHIQALPEHLKIKASDLHKGIERAKKAYPGIVIHENDFDNWIYIQDEFAQEVVNSYLGREAQKQTS